MKFGQELQGSLFAPWSSYYVNYEALKELIVELRFTYPYMRLLKHHDTLVENDPSEPFGFIINGVTFTFKDLDTAVHSKYTESFKVVSVKEKASSADGDGAAAEGATVGGDGKVGPTDGVEGDADNGDGPPLERSGTIPTFSIVSCPLPAPEQHVELFHVDPTNAALLKQSCTTVPKGLKRRTDGGSAYDEEDDDEEALDKAARAKKFAGIADVTFDVSGNIPMNGAASNDPLSDRGATSLGGDFISTTVSRFRAYSAMGGGTSSAPAASGAYTEMTEPLYNSMTQPSLPSAAPTRYAHNAPPHLPPIGVGFGSSAEALLDAQHVMAHKVLDMDTVGYADDSQQEKWEFLDESESAGASSPNSVRSAVDNSSFKDNESFEQHSNNDDGGDAADTNGFVSVRSSRANLGTDSRSSVAARKTPSTMNAAFSFGRRVFSRKKNIAEIHANAANNIQQGGYGMDENSGDLHRRFQRDSAEGRSSGTPTGSNKRDRESTSNKSTRASAAIVGSSRSSGGGSSSSTSREQLQQLQELFAMRLTLHIYAPIRLLNTCRYNNPAIAHALYVYQRTLSTRVAAALKIEIEKVGNFYLSQTHILCRAALLCVDAVKMWDTLTARERSQLRTVYRQTYLTFRILQQYCDLNIIAIGKFLKKLDKNTRQNSLESYRTALDTLHFRMGHDSRIMAVQKVMVEKLATHAMGGSNKKAFNFLESTGDENQYNDFSGSGGAGGSGKASGGGGAMGGMNRVGKGRVNASLAFMWGLFLSITMVIVALVISSGGQADLLLHHDDFGKASADYLILLPLIFAIPQFLFSINIMIYERFGINFAFMFDLDPIFHWTGAELMRDSLIYLCAWAFCVWVFLRNNYSALNCASGTDHLNLHSDVPSVAVLWAIFPIYFVIWVSIAAYNKYISVERRTFWSAHTFWRIITTPWYTVRFADFFICNYFTSITTALFEIQFYWCTFSTDPIFECTAGRSMSLCILNSLPNTWRMIQSVKRFYAQPKASRKPFPNLVNGGKYLTGVIQPIVWTMWSVAKYKKASEETLTAMYVLSFMSQFLTQSYKLTWDVVVDAGIFIDYGNGYEWRRQRVYGPWWPYYLFIIVDFTLRWRWMATYFIQLSFKPPWFFAVWSVIELIRRSFWSTFRVENEHVNNTEHYRATKLAPIPVKNIHAWDILDSSPEQFLSKTKKDQFSKDFPQIRGVNLSSVTRFYASLPEADKLKILRSNPLLCTPSLFSPSTTMVSNSGNGAPIINNKSTTALASSSNPFGPLPSAFGPSILSTFSGKAGEGKTKFFSELPEENKIVIILNFLGPETMNSFERKARKRHDEESVTRYNDTHQHHTTDDNHTRQQPTINNNIEEPFLK